jgi:hypothetical protein
LSNTTNTDNYIDKFLAAQKSTDPNVFIVDGTDFENKVRASQEDFAVAIMSGSTIPNQYNIISTTLDDENTLFVADSTMTPIVVTLPNASFNLGITMIVKWLAGANTVTIASGSGIDGNPTLVIPTLGDAIHMVAAPTGTSPTWIVI